MKRSYFIFYGSAVAYCISMLAALQIGSLSTTSSTVHKSTASSCYSHKTDCFESPTECSEKDKVVSSAIEPYIPAVSTISPEMSADREQQKNKMSSRNVYHVKTGSTESIRPALVHHDSLKKILSFMTSDKLCTSHHSDLASADMKAVQYGTSVSYSVEDSKSLGGFDSIIEFPDKLS
ncbi:hypothetical protein [Chryseobacterium herbae]|uniref:Uncharacterized protein n=1 Tax=Chryseobacterium herbae TaxID=2976476 RepID=A0ABT2IUJ2_9FLAO|nr:hypothetical protein [Chryseobacterium sp. pc1-10]MCT2562442.1 hypothetical protein [Chryseobacterium sp. pc1-10]